MDYVDVIVHIFLKEDRDYYDIEDLWGDLPQERIKG
jgi:ribosome-associated protein